MPLNILTFNIGGARKLRQPPHDPARTGTDAAETLRGLANLNDPTLIGLQETGRITWRDDRNPAAAYEALSRGLPGRYRAAFAPEVTSEAHPHANLWDRPAYRAPERGGFREAAEGNGIVTNLPSAGWPWPLYTGHSPRALVPLVVGISRAALYSTGSRDTQPRNLMLAAVLHPEYGPLYFMNTHLGTVSGEARQQPGHERTRAGEARRLWEVGEILHAVAELRAAEAANDVTPRPLILVGDFNAVPGSPPLTALTDGGFVLLPVENPPDDAWSHTGHRILIDHVLLSDPLGVLPGARVFVGPSLPHADLTDHRPVVAVFGG